MGSGLVLKCVDLGSRIWPGPQVCGPMFRDLACPQLFKCVDLGSRIWPGPQVCGPRFQDLAWSSSVWT